MACGGTGGHIYPALAIADTIKRKHPEAEILFIGTKAGMENQIVPANGYPIKSIDAAGINRKKIWKNIGTLHKAFEGYGEARRIIAGFQPDLVVGTGGYVCGPVVLAAHKMRIRTAIHEQNAFPGMTNKLLCRIADKVFISFEESRKYFKEKKTDEKEGHIVLTGNPLRRGFVMSDKKVARERLGVKDHQLMVLCFGGSLGSPRINELMLKLIGLFNRVEDVAIYFVTGSKHYEQIREKLEDNEEPAGDNIRIFPYIENMPEYMGAADVIISRAGALTIAELTACGKPAILIPSPYVTGNHQYYNAKVMADKGAAVLIEEKDLRDEAVIQAISQMRKSREMIRVMEAASRSLAKTDAAETIYEQIRGYIER